MNSGGASGALFTAAAGVATRPGVKSDSIAPNESKSSLDVIPDLTNSWLATWIVVSIASRDDDICTATSDLVEYGGRMHFFLFNFVT